MLYKTTEWQSPTGKWYCNNVDDLAGIGSKWWIPARILNISLEEYVLLLINTFKVDTIKYLEDGDVLIFSWNSQSAMRKYKNWINKKAKEINFIY